MKTTILIKSAFDGEQVIIPVKKTKGAHCFDIALGCDVKIAPNQIVKVGTGLCMQIPFGYAVKLIERSSTVTNYGINVEAGIIDSDFRDHVKLVLNKKPRISFLEKFKQVKLFYSWREIIFKPWKIIKSMEEIDKTRNAVLFLKKGTRVAQAEVVKTEPEVEFVVTKKSLSKTKRKGGFGSTGS